MAMNRMIDRRAFAGGLMSASLLAAAGRAVAADPPTLLFRNVRLFDGLSGRISGPTEVLIRGNRIAGVGTGGATADRAFDCGGRILMPGLIDAHTHLSQAAVALPVLLRADPNYIQFVAGRTASNLLAQGFTAARDVGGPVFGLKRAIDEDILPGPRIWPAGAPIGQTSGHSDFRSPNELPWPEGQFHWTERAGAVAVADGPDQVRRRVRENLMRGASHIKMMAGGGVASDFDPLDVSQYGPEELRAGVDAATAWNTYVTVHAYTPRAIRIAIEAGVRCIEHGQLADEATIRLMAERGIWLSIQPFLDDADAIPFPEGSENRAKQLEMVSGTDTAFRLAKQYRVNTAFGTDTLFDARLATRQGAQLAKLARWYTPGEVLKMATGDNGRLLALSGPRSPYKGRIGVIAPDALADLLLVEGDPVANIRLIEEPANAFVAIMKDGRFYRNRLDPEADLPLG
jgi:imidazolonepropionase-like amidohydrolase